MLKVKSGEKGYHREEGGRARAGGGCRSYPMDPREKRVGCGEKDNPLLDFSERSNNKKAGRWAEESIAAQ